MAGTSGHSSQSGSCQGATLALPAFRFLSGKTAAHLFKQSVCPLNRIASLPGAERMGMCPVLTCCHGGRESGRGGLTLGRGADSQHRWIIGTQPSAASSFLGKGLKALLI